MWRVEVGLQGGRRSERGDSSTSPSPPSTFSTSSSGGGARIHVLFLARHLRRPSLRELAHELLSPSYVSRHEREPFCSHELAHELLSPSLCPALRCYTLAPRVLVA